MGTCRPGARGRFVRGDFGDPTRSRSRRTGRVPAPGMGTRQKRRLRLGDLRLGGAAVCLDLNGQRLLLDPVLVLQQPFLRSRQRDPDPVGQLEALFLAHRVDLVDQVEHERLELELRVERRLERNRDAVVTCDGPAFLAALLDEDLLRPELVLADSEAAAVELIEFAARQRFSHVAPSFGPSSGRFGFTRSSLASTSPNSTSFTRSSSAISSACERAASAPATTTRRSGCRSFSRDVARAWR